jgi:hypothetical protein
MMRAIAVLLLTASCGGVMPAPKPMAVPLPQLPAACPAEPEELPKIAPPEVVRARHDKLQSINRTCASLYLQARKQLEAAQKR